MLSKPMLTLALKKETFSQLPTKILLAPEEPHGEHEAQLKRKRNKKDQKTYPS
jgi:hypothetical protein